MPEATPDRPLDSINRTLARLVRLSSSRAAFARQASAAGVPITQPSYQLLRIMIDRDGTTMTESARLAHMDLGMVTRQVNRLVVDGLVLRQRDPADGRLMRVQATAAGARLAAALQQVRMDHLERALADWSEKDLRTFDRLLTRFVADTSATPFDE